ncbi:complex I NDUFA9 subunit family protein [Ottowia thiooxydans]|uniref:complex I NDUFA9 subunit family protein n=1 Tax=Ottowia thiooxydans TaxID=219182 RepID=UPI00048DD4CA|nr:complex I NDUFA9 subunit family protein [Ottowia thiooxydans]
MQRALVLGGGGFVGRYVCEHLQRQGWRTIVPTRQYAAGKHLLSLPSLQLVEADVMAPGELERLLPGCHAVINLIAVLHGSEKTFARVHVEWPRQVAQACTQAGVRRLIHVSALGADSGGPSRYQRSKAEGEAVLRAAATAGLLDLTVLRPSVIFGREDRFMNLFARLQKFLLVMPLSGADARLQPVWVRDVGQAIARALDDDATIGQTYEACGPDVFTLGELVRLAGCWAGVRGGRGRPVIGLPMGIGKLQALVMELISSKPLMSRDNLDSLRVDNIAGGQLPGLAALGVTPAPLGGVVPLYLGDAGFAARFNEMRRRAGR